jgi:uncharacterized protein (TIGR02646 family)
MRYIEKSITPPPIMTEWINLRKEANQSFDYDDFDKKKELNEILRIEQRHICCYCQQIITHYQGDNWAGSHNEHLIPQRGKFGNSDLQMDYFNIFASCNYSKNNRPGHTYCGEAKGDRLIYPIINDPMCSEYVKYNTLGEILPNGKYSSIAEYVENSANLSTIEADILNAIQVLNLNCNYLRNERKSLLNTLFEVIIKIDKERLVQKINDFESGSKCYRFIDMLLYYMKMKV